MTDVVDFLDTDVFLKRGLIATFDSLYVSDTAQGVVSRLGKYLARIKPAVPDITLDVIMDTLLKNGDIDAASWLQVAVAHREEELRADNADVTRAYLDVRRRSQEVYGPDADTILPYAAVMGHLQKMRAYLSKDTNCYRLGDA